MTTEPRSFHNSVPIHLSRNDLTTGLSAMSFQKSRSALTPEDAEREWFAGLIRKATPDAASDHERGEILAEILTTDRRPVTSRTVRNWLGGHNSPHFRYVMHVIGLVGAESVFQIIDPEASA